MLSEYYTLALVGLFVLWALLSWLMAYSAHPALSILIRWVRWVLFALLFAVAVSGLEALSGRPLWLLMVTGALLWLLLETLYNWVAITALSRGGYALFPVFRHNSGGDEWPANKRYFHAREILRKKDYRHQTSMKAEIAEGLDLRSSIYNDATGKIRLQVIFIPMRSGSLAMSFVLTSQGKSGARYITDNVFVPFGGFYPESWLIERHPLWISLEKLMLRHRHRMKLSGEEFEIWQDDPIEDLNHQQHLLEVVNTRAGFLTPREFQEEFGRLTSDGRYRLWKELWLLNYFGRASSPPRLPL